MAKKKKMKGMFKCDKIDGERFYAPPTENVFKFNWWEIFCFPYILLSRLGDCFLTLCSGNNPCLVYWLTMQWLMCKITQIITPDPIFFPYYFNVFSQVIILSGLFILLWIMFGNTVVIPFLSTIWSSLVEDEKGGSTSVKKPRLRRYCLRKGEIFDSSFKGESGAHQNTPVLNVIFTFIGVFIFDVFHQ